MKKKLALLLFSILCIQGIFAKAAVVFKWKEKKASFKQEQEIFVASFTESYKKQKIGFKPTSDVLDDDIELFRKSDIVHTLVACDSVQCAGFAIVEYDEKQKNAYIVMFVVSPLYWKQGIGIRLFEEIKKKFSPSTIILACRNVNKDAQKFYKKMGFVKTKTVPKKLGSIYNPQEFYGFRWEKKEAEKQQ